MHIFEASETDSTSDFEEGLTIESGDRYTDADFCSLRCSLNFHEGDNARVQSVTLSGACTPVTDHQPEDDDDFWKYTDPDFILNLQQFLELNVNNMLCMELNIIGLMQRCENDTSLVAAVLSSFFAQGSSCCLKLQQALETDQRDQLLLQAVTIPTQSPDIAPTSNLFQHLQSISHSRTVAGFHPRRCEKCRR